MFKKKPNIKINLNNNGYPELHFEGNITEEALKNAVKLLNNYYDTLYPKTPTSNIRPEENPESSLYGFHTVWEALI